MAFLLFFLSCTAEARGQDAQEQLENSLLIENLPTLSQAATKVPRADEDTKPRDYFFDIEAIHTEVVPKWFEFHGAISQTVLVDGRDDKTQRDTTKLIDQTSLTLWLGVNILKSLSFTSEIDVENGFEIEAERGHFNWNILGDLLTVRAGKFVYPFGIERFQYSEPFNKLVDRPSPMVRIVPGLYTDVGVEFLGTVPIPHIEGLKYEFAITNGLDSFDHEGRQKDLADNNTNKQLGGRLGLVLLPGLEIGGSFLTGKYDIDNDNRLFLAGADIAYRRGGLEFRGEYVTGKVELDNGEDFHRNGYYLQTSYRHPFELDYLKYLEGVVRFDSVNPRDDVLNDEDADRIALGINYSPVENLTLKFEYEINNQSRGGEDNVFVQVVWRW
ncbi:MAG: porin [Candidatus Brocadiales bacterium]